MTNLEVSALLDMARGASGLDDFGDDSFLEGLEILVRSLNTESKLSEFGSMAIPFVLMNSLVQRLQIEDWYKRHPEIDDEQIVRPLIGLGLPRTGSTALSNLLNEDPNAQSLLTWQSSSPCPPPSTVKGDDPRIAAAEQRHREQLERSPRMQQLVPSSPTGPMECQELMALDFKSQQFQAFAHIPSYSKWLVDADLDSTYAYERRALKLLQWGNPTKPWRLKCPTHLLFLDHLDKSFPDAVFVMTHRDPTEVIFSVADVYVEVGQQFSESLDKQYLGALNLAQWSEAMRRVVDFRRGGNDHRFFDLDFRAVQRDPIGSVTSLYEWLGEPVSSEFEAGMTRWWQEFAANREENVHPDPSEYGLNVDAVASAFAGYNEHAARWLKRGPSV
jgi:Sulfotransferase family